MCESPAIKGRTGWRGWLEIPSRTIQKTDQKWVDLTYPFSTSVPRSTMFPPSKFSYFAQMLERLLNITYMETIVATAELAVDGDVTALGREFGPLSGAVSGWPRRASAGAAVLLQSAFLVLWRGPMRVLGINELCILHGSFSFVRDGRPPARI